MFGIKASRYVFAAFYFLLSTARNFIVSDAMSIVENVRRGHAFGAVLRRRFLKTKPAYILSVLLLTKAIFRISH